MSAAKDVGDFVDGVIHLFFELCRRAESEIDQGPYSGAKRSILLLLMQAGPLQAHELGQRFDDPLAENYIDKVIGDLTEKGWVRLSGFGENPRLHLTERGQDFCKKMRSAEMRFAETLANHLKLDDLKTAHKVILSIKEMSKMERTTQRQKNKVA